MHPISSEVLECAETPALILAIDGVKSNLEKTLAIAEEPSRLWPHIKTHKTAELITMIMDSGVRSFKCATIAEAELLARTGAEEVLIAYPLIGPHIARLRRLVEKYQKTRFHTLVDSKVAFLQLKTVFSSLQIGVFLDLDVGMHRTGITPGVEAVELYGAVAGSDTLSASGFHVYDGHNRQNSADDRRGACAGCYNQVLEFKRTVENRGFLVPHMIFGGTPTFPCYAGLPEAALSPGTAFLYDWGYKTMFPDLPFEPAAWVLGRVISSTADNLFTLDVGSKAIATDPAGDRGLIVDMPEARPVSQSEEHWVFEAPDAHDFSPGEAVLITPTHICPTVNLYHEAVVVDSAGNQIDTWEIVARERKLSL